MAQQSYEEAVAEVQARADSLLRLFDELDFTDMSAALIFLYELQSITEWPMVNFDRKGVVQTFVSHGYEPNAGIGDAYNWRQDLDVFGRFIVGKALDTLWHRGRIDRDIHEWVNQWTQLWQAERDQAAG